MQLCTCRFCSKMFYAVREVTVCTDCEVTDNRQFERIENYLKQYPNSNAMQIAEGLEIQTTEIIRYINEGRLQMVKGEFIKL